MATTTRITFNQLPLESSNALSLDNINKLIANLGQRGLSSQPLGREIFRQAQLPSLNKALRANAFIDEDRARLLRAAEENQARLSRNASVREQQRLRDIANTPVITGGTAHKVGFAKQEEQRQLNVRLPSGENKSVFLDIPRPGSGGLSNVLMPNQSAKDQALINQSIFAKDFRLNPGIGFKSGQQPKSLQGINSILGVGRSTRR